MKSPHTSAPAAGSTLTPRAEEFVAEWLSDSPCVQAHTSGTTGKPKPVRLLKSDMLESARATNRFFGIDHSLVLLLPLSADYIAGKMQIVRAMAAGCPIICEEPSNRPFTDSVTLRAFDRATMLPVVPSQVASVLRSGLWRRVDNIIVGGAPLGHEAERLLTETGVNAYATYGMTETCSHVALRRLGTRLYRGLPGFRFSVDGRGCLEIESDRMSFGRLVTNDIVSLSPGGDGFEWLGRADNVINSGGIKIHPEEIESRLAPLVPEECHFYISSRPSEKWGEEAVLVTDYFGLLDTELLDHMFDRIGLEPIKRPKEVCFQEIRFTPSGKIIREKPCS